MLSKIEIFMQFRKKISPVVSFTSFGSPQQRKHMHYSDILKPVLGLKGHQNLHFQQKPNIDLEFVRLKVFIHSLCGVNII